MTTEPPDPLQEVLLRRGPPQSPEEKAQYLEQYKIMVQSSESLVQRRQGTNTFFLTANGLLLTSVGLVLREGAEARSHSILIAMLAFTGLVISWAWRSLLLSFGQLNKGKFAVILRLEQHLPAAVFDAEWEALERGANKAVYRSFTDSEVRVPWIFIAAYVVALIASVLIALGWSPT